MEMAQKTAAIAHEIEGETIAYRRYIHRHPELSMKEIQTTESICCELDKLGVNYRMIEPTGVIAEITGTAAESSQIVMLRCDIDALEIEEKTGLPFASVNQGIMHACGHDTHVAMLIGAAKVLVRMRDEFAGTVRLVFQPGEEVCKGAPAMIAQGAMDGVGYSFGMHIISNQPCGTIVSMPGPMYAAANRYWIRVYGKTSHGSDPVNGVDAAVAGGNIIAALQTLVSREFPPTEALVVTVGQIHAGTRFNIIPGYCEIEGTIRTFSREVFSKVNASVDRIAREIARAYRCEAETEFEAITGVLMVDETAYEIGRNAAEKLIPGQFIVGKPSMLSEDYAYYTEVDPEKKCAFFQLGAAVDDPEQVYSQHHEKVRFKEDALEIGVAFYAQTALDALEKLNLQGKNQ